MLSGLRSRVTEAIDYLQSNFETEFGTLRADLEGTAESPRKKENFFSDEESSLDTSFNQVYNHNQKSNEIKILSQNSSTIGLLVWQK